MATQTQSTDRPPAEAVPLLGYAGFIQEALASWEAFQRDGQHITGDEMFAWLNTWGTGAAPPACHD